MSAPHETPGPDLQAQLASRIRELEASVPHDKDCHAGLSLGATHPHFAAYEVSCRCTRTPKIRALLVKAWAASIDAAVNAAIECDGACGTEDSCTLAQSRALAAVARTFQEGAQ
jgi:hypothetical protein